MIKPARTWPAIALLLALAAASLITLLWWLLIGRPERDATRLATAKAGTVVADKRGAAASDAARVIERHFTETRRIERIHDAAQSEIRSAVSPADLHRAGVAAVCLLSPTSGAADPACALRQTDPAKPNS
jgi:hypothetical protein